MEGTVRTIMTPTGEHEEDGEEDDDDDDTCHMSLFREAAATFSGSKSWPYVVVDSHSRCPKRKRRRCNWYNVWYPNSDLRSYIPPVSYFEFDVRMKRSESMMGEGDDDDRVKMLRSFFVFECILRDNGTSTSPSFLF